MPGSDINGDGRDDLLFRNTDGMFTVTLAHPQGYGTEAIWQTYGLQRQIWVPVEWHVAGTGDFNGDGRADVFWRHDDGRMTDWLGLSNGGFFDNAANGLTHVPVEWRVAGTGDFNGDGRADVFWRHDDGRMTDWLGLPNGGFFDNAANGLTHVPIEWRVAGFGDFNGDGRDDILWRHDDGRLSNWLGLPNGGFVDNAANGLTAVPTEWQVDGIGDFNGDGRDDIVWHHDDGRFSEWLGLPNGGFFDNARNDIFSYNGELGRNTLYFNDRIDAVGDFNGDGRDDVLAVSRTGNPNGGTIWLGQPDGRFFYGGPNDSGGYDGWVLQSADNGRGFWDY